MKNFKRLLATVYKQLLFLKKKVQVVANLLFGKAPCLKRTLVLVLYFLYLIQGFSLLQLRYE
jgi:hypothetical protein